MIGDRPHQGRRRWLAEVPGANGSTSEHVCFDYRGQSAIQRTESGGRTGHVSGIWPITTSNQTHVDMETTHYYAAAYMAMEHFNSRNGAVIPELPELLKGCDFYLTSDVRDDQLSINSAVASLDQALCPVQSTNTSHPFAILASLTSGVTLPLSILNDVNKIVQISGTVTSMQLDDINLFSRTIPSNQGEASAFMTYFQSIDVERIGILYVQDAYGESFNEALRSEAKRNKIEIEVSMPYNQYRTSSIETSMRLLKGSNVRYIIAIVDYFNDGWKPVIRAAAQYGMMGRNSGYQWYMAEFVDLLRHDFALDPVTETDLAEAIHGMGIIHARNLQSAPFQQEFEKLLLAQEAEMELIHNTTMRERFIASHLEPQLYDNVQFTRPDINLFHYANYDSMIALGVAACRTPGLFTTEEFFTQLLNSEFPGASGWISLDRITGSRLAKDLEYNLDNILLSPTKSTDTSLRFSTQTSLTIQDDNITQHLHDFVFADNTTIPPSELPALTSHNYNFISTWALAVGWTLGGLLLIVSVAFMVWTICNRNKQVVRVGQPLFLCQLCIGTTIMALTIIPLSMQEQLLPDGSLYSQWNLDAACMAAPWLFFTGYATSISAILAKTIRLNRVMKNSAGMRRIVVREKDVLQPLIVMLTLNVGLLLACTLVAPYTRHRVPYELNVDRFGRSLESYGTCLHFLYGLGVGNPTYYFTLPMVVVNFGGALVAAYQCYKARNLPTEMSESHHLFIATLSLLETYLIGVPILFLPIGSTSIHFVVKYSVVVLTCFSFLIPIFVPKYLQSKALVRQQGRRHLVDMRTMDRKPNYNTPTNHGLGNAPTHTALRPGQADEPSIGHERRPGEMKIVRHPA